jgi:xanthine dehydrogenase accessory factor
MPSPTLCRNVLKLLAASEPFAMALIVSQNGSAPRHAGSRMLVRCDGSIVGSVGGGALEAYAICLAQRSLAEGVALTHTFVLRAERDALGMICGGEAEVLVYPLNPTHPEWLMLYQALAARLAARESGWLITRLTPEIGQWLMSEAGLITGVARLAAETWATLLQQADPRRPIALTHGGSRFLIEPIVPPGRLYIFGAGHIGQQLAGLAMLADFAVMVLDDRPEFASRERFPQVQELAVLASYAVALAGLTLDADSFLVIVTHGHAGDLTVLRQALRSPVGYIGMIGSRHKRDALYGRLLQEGFTVTDLQRVHCPIGLAIGAETPAEIAFSIIAELIQVRAARNARR